MNIPSEMIKIRIDELKKENDFLEGKIQKFENECEENSDEGWGKRWTYGRLNFYIGTLKAHEEEISALNNLLYFIKQ